MTPRPTSGRVFAAGRRVRLGDADPQGRVRLDALARYLQDVSRDDSADADYPEPMAWVVRRTLIEVARFPRFQEWLDLSTWCSGFGGRWAERSTELRGDRGGAVNAVSVWVHVDGRTGAARQLPEEFHRLWGASAAGRRISARLVLPPEPPPDGAVRVPWRMRAADLDVMNHMNNAAHWSALVEAVARLGRLGRSGPASRPGSPPSSPTTGPTRCRRAELEHIAPIGADRPPALWAAPVPGGTAAWLTTEGAPATAARFSTSSPPQPPM